jgi:uncharacterized protein YbaR (Trm112 family)
MPGWILEFLRCPHSGGKLSLAHDTSISKLIELSLEGKLFDAMGRTVSQFSSQGLVSENGRWAYRIENGALCLLAEEAVDMRDLKVCETSGRGEV